jgi:error-prone DNA polymerase
MICAADTVGVFQIESRAQMSMLPRLQPRVFYDLVVQVAIVRPGPIQGGMVHPYLQARERRRHGEPLELEKPELEGAGAHAGRAHLSGTGDADRHDRGQFLSPGMADDLRRSMAAWKRKGGVHRFERLIGGMEATATAAEFAQAIFQQMLGFGEYGFPESHAYSFALLAYAAAGSSATSPRAFLAALLNSLPMGFYSASQLVQDARRHGVRVLPIDVNQRLGLHARRPVGRRAGRGTAPARCAPGAAAGQWPGHRCGPAAGADPASAARRRGGQARRCTRTRACARIRACHMFHQHRRPGPARRS